MQKLIHKTPEKFVVNIISFAYTYIAKKYFWIEYSNYVYKC